MRFLGMREVEEKIAKINEQKKALEKEIASLSDRLSEAESKNEDINRAMKKIEGKRSLSRVFSTCHFLLRRSRECEEADRGHATDVATSGGRSCLQGRADQNAPGFK